KPSGNLVLDLGRKIPARCIIHIGQTAQGAHRCVHRCLQPKRQAVRLDQSQSSSASRQRATYQSTVIPGTSAKAPYGTSTLVLMAMDSWRDGQPDLRARGNQSADSSNSGLGGRPNVDAVLNSPTGHSSKSATRTFDRAHAAEFTNQCN